MELVVIEKELIHIKTVSSFCPSFTVAHSLFCGSVLNCGRVLSEGLSLPCGRFIFQETEPNAPLMYLKCSYIPFLHTPFDNYKLPQTSLQRWEHCLLSVCVVVTSNVQAAAQTLWEL